MPMPFDLKSQLGFSDNPIVQCACGRDVNADMMRDIRLVKQMLLARASGEHPCEGGVSDATHLCDSCMEHFHRNEILSHEEFYRAHGAPAKLIALHAQRDKSLKEARNV